MFSSSRTLPTQPTTPAGDVFRDMEDARWFLAEFVPCFDGCSQVLDVACGWGMFMDHLLSAGITCQGIDHHPDAVNVCREHGHDTVQAEALTFLRASNSLWDGIMLSHIIEHFDEKDGQELLRLSWEHLRPAGVLVVVTPNMANPNVRKTGFWADPTHVRPFTAAEIACELSAAGAMIDFCGDSQVERNRFRKRFQRNFFNGAACWLDNWRRSGLTRRFLLGDTIVVARRPPALKSI